MNYLSKLQNKLVETFSLEELSSLCLSVGVDYDSLSGQGKSEKVRELVLYLKRRQALSRLQEALPQLRPFVEWRGLIDEAEREKLEVEPPARQSRTAGPAEINISGGSVGQIINTDNIGSIDGNFSFGDREKK
jgi:hypothetical protein